MIVSLAFITGFKHTVREKLFSFWGQVLVVPFNPNDAEIVPATSMQADRKLQQQIGSMTGVMQVAPFALRPAILQAGETMEGIRLKGLPKGFRFNRSITFTGNPITYPDSGYSQQIILSQTTASRMQVKTGDALLSYYLEPSSSSPRVRKIIVAGIYHTGMEEVDKQFALCDIRLVQRLAGWQENEISGYQVELAKGNSPDSAAMHIHDNYLVPPIDARPISNIFAGVYSWLGMQDVNARILLIILSIVGIINLSAAVIILMVDRAVMLGLLQALGMESTRLRYLFLWVAGLIGFCGVVLGNIIGLSLCLLQAQFKFIKLPEETYYMRTAPVSIVWWHVALVDIGVILLCIVCTSLPLLYIRRIQPARVLQFK